MLNRLKIDEAYRLGSLGPYLVYKPEEATYVFIVDETDETVILDENGDNFIIVTAGSFSEAIDVFSAAMG